MKKHPYSDKTTVLICCSVRDKAKVNQVVLCKIGTSNDPKKLDEMEGIANDIISKIDNHKIMPTVQQDSTINLQLDQIREINRHNTGVKDIVGTLYERLGFSKILDNPKMNEVLKAVILARFTEPSSKLKASSILQRKFGLEHSVDSIYRMMDCLHENADKAKKAVFSSTVATVGQQIDLMFFDVTTLHFETIEEDELRNFGFSKDFRFNTTQVVLALATTQEGLPIGYKLFPGNTAEVTTLINCVKEWKTQIGIGDAVVVADRGMMSDDNLKKLVEAGMNYVVAFPLRKLSRDIKAQILAREDYQCTEINKQEYWKKEITLPDNRRLIVTFNQKRHDKDRKDRERLIKRIEKRLGPSKSAKKLVSNQGYIKYVTIDGNITAELNTKKITEDAAWDGLHGVITNTNLSAEEVVSRYKQLWVIEESFRINKHNLKMRPIYHFTPKKIHSHITICFLTYTIIRQIQYIIKQNNLQLSIEDLREELLDVQASIITDTRTGELYKMPSYMAAEIQELYRIFGLGYELTTRRYVTE